MTLDYDKRTDFRAFDVLIDAIDNATSQELQVAIKTCAEYANNTALPASQCLIWRDMARLLRSHLKR
jgi:hypothetical protein